MQIQIHKITMNKILLYQLTNTLLTKVNGGGYVLFYLFVNQKFNTSATYIVGE